MASERIEDISGGTLTSLASGDLFVVLDVSDATDDADGTAKNIAWSTMAAAATGPWTDGGTTTYLTSTADDLAIGGTDSDAPLFFDTSTSRLTLKNDSAPELELIDTNHSGVASIRAVSAHVYISNKAASGGSDLLLGTGGRTDDIRIDGSTSYVGINEGIAEAQIHITAGAATDIVGIFKGAASQTADLIQGRNSSDAVKFKVEADGKTVVHTNGSTLPTISGDTSFVVADTAAAATTCMISIIAGNTGISKLNFGDTDSETDGAITYSHANREMSFNAGAVAGCKIDNNSTAGETRFMLYDVDNATMERVTVGAADSGGSGYKVLRIPN